MTDSYEMPDELTLLKQRATDLGIAFSPNIGLETLRTKVNAKLNGDVSAPSDEETSTEVIAEGVENSLERRQRLGREARALMRVTVLNNNPNKKDWGGEIFQVSNRVIGTVKRFIPFGQITHIERVLLDQMREREMMQFYSATNEKGMKVRKHKLVKEFNIQEHAQLTEDELRKLAIEQAARGALQPDA